MLKVEFRTFKVHKWKPRQQKSRKYGTPCTVQYYCHLGMAKIPQSQLLQQGALYLLFLPRMMLVTDGKKSVLCQQSHQPVPTILTESLLRIWLLLLLHLPRFLYIPCSALLSVCKHCLTKNCTLKPDSSTQCNIQPDISVSTNLIYKK